MTLNMFRKSSNKPPAGLRWRSSVWYVTFVVGLGVMTDLLVYSIVIPVLPFQLEHLGYKHVSSLVGWLLFGYSAGLVVSTPPIASFSEHYNTRTYPLISGQIILIGSQIMLMEAPTYWVMVFARVIQGISSSMIWVVGLALLCDTASEASVGKHLGIAMTGLSVGSLLGPLLGGILYNHFGFRGPIILGIIVTVVDLVGRLLIIERKDALQWGVDPAATDSTTDEKQQVELGEVTAASKNENAKDGGDSSATPSTSREARAMPTPPTPIRHAPLSLIGVVRKLARSPRALAVMLDILVYGIVVANLEPSLPVHLQGLYGLNALKVGLVFLGGVIPTLISSPLGGWCTDRYGTEWLTFGAVLLTMPWYGLLIPEINLTFFIVMFCMSNFFLGAVMPALSAELATLARIHDGVGYAHVYGAFNLSFGIGSAVGPVIGGQIYDHVKRGWMAVCVIAIGMLGVCAVVSFLYVGDWPLIGRVLGRRRSQETPPEGIPVEEATS